jgi:hypothetical protein
MNHAALLQGRSRMRAFLPASIGLGLALLAAAGCDGDNSASNVTAPGTPPSARTEVLATGTALLQEKQPLEALDVYVDGFHFANGDLSHQMEAHHYCSVVNEDLRQCVIFDGNGRDAKLMGVEYIVSRALFEQLPPEERKLWHSHDYEVKSGTLIAPGVPEAAEHEFMEQMAGTYGKTWHTWHTDRQQSLPLGHPLLMAGFTADGQVDAQMVADRDRRFGVSTAEKRKARDDIIAPPVLDGANAWQRGEVLQLALQPVAASSMPAVHGQQGSPASGDPRKPATDASRSGTEALPAREDRSNAAPTRKLKPARGPQLYAFEPR